MTTSADEVNVDSGGAVFGNVDAFSFACGGQLAGGLFLFFSSFSRYCFWIPLEGSGVLVVRLSFLPGIFEFGDKPVSAF